MGVCRPGAFVDLDEWPAAFGAGWPSMAPPLDGHGLGGRENSGGALDIIWLVIGMAVVFAALGAAGFGLPAWALAGAAAFGIIAYVATRRQRGNELRRA